MARHPALYLGLAFGSGIVSRHLGQIPALLCASSFLAATFSAFLFSHYLKTSKRNLLSDAALLVAMATAGMLRTHFAETPTRFEVSRWADDNAEVLLLGESLEMPEQRRDYWRVPIAVHALWRADSIITRVHGTVLASGKNLARLVAGDQAIVRGRLLLADGARNPGAFDYRAYLLANGIVALFSCSDSVLALVQAQPDRVRLARIANRARVWLRTRIDAFADGQTAALIDGMLLGDLSNLDSDVLESFAHTGLIHILSISGLHVGFLALLLMLAAGLARVAKRWQGLLVIIALWCYAYLTGMRPPIVRAVVMASVILAGQRFERQTNLPNNLSVAALFILLWQPLQLFQTGFQLSFAAVAGLTFLYKPTLFGLTRLVPWRWPPLRWVLALLAASLAAQLATLPIVALAYGRVPCTALWGNLIVIPLAFVVMATAVLACLFAPLSDFMMQIYGAVADLAAMLTIAFTKWLATLPWAYIEGIHLAPLLILSYVMALVTFVAWRKSVRRWSLLSALFVLNLHVWLEAWNAAPHLRITFFDVGQGDAALLEFPRGRRLLIDAGPWLGGTSMGERVLVPYLHRAGIRRLHAIIISHPHADHFGGLPALLQAVKIDTVYHCGTHTNSELERRSMAVLDSLGVPYELLQANARLESFAPAVLTTLCTRPPGNVHGRSDNLNDASLVLKVIFGRISMLFPGDAELESETHLLQHKRMLDSDLLKIGHHGSRTSSSEEFLHAISPQWAVISAGRNNKFGHPDTEVLKRCDSLGIALTRTDQNGAIIFETEGKSLWRVR